MENEKKVIYLAGPITGVPDYRERFTLAEAMVRRAHPSAVILNPATLPDGLTLGQYMRICLAMMDCADEVVFLAGWGNSVGAGIERSLCAYTKKTANDLWKYRSWLEMREKLSTDAVPAVRYADKFFAAHPRAEREADGTPVACRNHIYGDGCGPCMLQQLAAAGADQDGIEEAAGTACTQCWREAYR